MDDDRTEENVPADTNALNLRWSFGFNASVAGSVHNLATPKRNAVFYVSSHTGVIHDTDRDMQYLLQGHCNPITAVCVSKDKRWIATADSGDDSMIVVWDSLKATPVKIITQPYAQGIVAMDMSADAMFLVTLSADLPQQVAVWEWTVTTRDPAIAADIGDHEYQHCVRFNPVDVRDIVSNGQNKVIFWNWTEEALSAFHPPRGIRKLKRNVGALTQTVFIPYTTKAVTATVSGNVVLWDYPISELVQASGRDAIKTLKLVDHTGINLLDTVMDRYVVCGCVDGAVRFFDFQFRVVAWFEDIRAGQITSVSFAETAAPQSAPSTAGNVAMDDFQVPDFVVSTSEGKILRLESRMMDHVLEEKRRGALLVQGFDGDVQALDAHPSLPLFAAGTTSGTLQVWDIDDRVISATRKFLADDKDKGGEEGGGGHPGQDSSVITCVKFGPMGDLLAVGFANGVLKLLSAVEAAGGQAGPVGPLDDIRSFHNSIDTITDICFSPDGQYMATADADRCVGLYRYYHRDEEEDKPVEWIYVGKFRAHYKPITGIYFSLGRRESEVQNEDDQDEEDNENREEMEVQLFSLGEDRILHEYAVGESTMRAGLKVRNSTKVDQVATPTACVCIPGHPVENREESMVDPEELLRQQVSGGPSKRDYTPDLVVTANDEYKLKVWDLSSGLPDVNYYADYNNHYEDGGTDDDHEHSQKARNIKVCRKTLLAPSYGGPINKLFVLPKREGPDIKPSKFLVYSTYKKVVGLIQLPLDGNPNKAMALIAHPDEISCVVCSFDGKYLITAGGKDRSVNLWAVSTDTLEASIALGGAGVDPYMGLLEGGKRGEFYQDLLDYFYYAQLCSQGIETTAARKITGFIPVDQVVYLMRALGYYPTQQEVMDICNEIKFAHYAQISSFKDKVDLEEFIKLYVNYRPVFGLGNSQFRAAFKALKGEQDSEPQVRIDTMGLEEIALPSESLDINTDTLLDKLLTMGEKMDEKELAEAVRTLVGCEVPPGADLAELRDVLRSALAPTYSPDTFTQELLGFEDYGKGD